MKRSLHATNGDNIYWMFIISIFSGLLSGMFIYSNKFSDIYITLNDLYMAFLMTGWMFLLMGIVFVNSKYFILGLLLVILNIYLIRTQKFINLNQYLSGMSIHHSTAVFMSNKFKENYPDELKKNKELDTLVNNIITNQEKEIELMKKLNVNPL